MLSLTCAKTNNEGESEKRLIRQGYRYGSVGLNVVGGGGWEGLVAGPPEYDRALEHTWNIHLSSLISLHPLQGPSNKLLVTFVAPPQSALGKKKKRRNSRNIKNSKINV